MTSTPANVRILDPAKYKTTLCRTWVRTGSCPYDFKCQFAHGQDDLRQRRSTVAAKVEKPWQKRATRAPLSSWRQNENNDDALKSAGALVACSSTPVCSPCSSPASSRVCSPVSQPASRTSTPPPPPGLLATPPGLLATPPGLPTPPGLLRPATPPQLKEVEEEQPRKADVKPAVRFQLPAATVGPIDFAVQDGAAGHFAAPSASQQGYVPDGVRALWQDDGAAGSHARAESPLRCNRTTGKVEVPWLARRMSSAGMLVRRAVSFVLDEGSARVSKRRSEADSKRRSEMEETSRKSVAY